MYNSAETADEDYEMKFQNVWKLDEDDSWYPVQMAVNGRVDRRVVCVVEERGQKFKTIDLEGEVSVEIPEMDFS
jgi:hypothetical protein